MSRNIPIPTATKRAIDVPAQTKLLYREPVAPNNREELKRKLESAEQATSKIAHVEEPLAPIEAEEEEEVSVSSDESSDEEEALMRELAKIKQERAEAQLKRKAEQEAKEEAIAQANPLLSGGASALRRRWDDDTVFRGQAAKPAAAKKNTFVNDAVRSHSHKKFLNKYVV
jgi:hypothetical protein